MALLKKQTPWPVKHFSMAPASGADTLTPPNSFASCLKGPSGGRKKDNLKTPAGRHKDKVTFLGAKRLLLAQGMIEVYVLISKVNAFRGLPSRLRNDRCNAGKAPLNRQTSFHARPIFGLIFVIMSLFFLLARQFKYFFRSQKLALRMLFYDCVAALL